MTERAGGVGARRSVFFRPRQPLRQFVDVTAWRLGQTVAKLFKLPGFFSRERAIIITLNCPNGARDLARAIDIGLLVVGRRAGHLDSRVDVSIIGISLSPTV
jgi:hypothetical protein